MKLLLDTHVFLWYLIEDRKLPTRWTELIRDPNNDVYLSVVSVWEAIIKSGLGKLSLPDAPERYLPTQRDRHHVFCLDLDEGNVCRLSTLPVAHRDPFDRMLVCQAIQHSMTIVTLDTTFDAYPAPILNW